MKHLKSTSALGLVIALACSTGAIAQDMASSATTATSDQDQINEIIVTAQRREESLSRVGVTITALGADSLARQSVKDPTQLAGLIPGFQATQSFGGAPVYTLRGIGFATRNPSSTAPIGLYLDQGALPYPYMAQGVSFDLERVEALKGPQGTLYGRNATGGLINYVSAKPTSAPAGGVTFEVGSYKTLNVSGFVSGPISDLIRARFAFDSQNRFQGWQHSITRDETIGKIHQQALRGIVDIGDGGPFTATLAANAWWRRGDSLIPQAIFNQKGGTAFSDPLAVASINPNPTSAKAVDWASVSRQPQADIGIFRPAPLVNSRYVGVTLNMGYQLAEGVRIVSLTSYNDLHHRDVAETSGVQTESLVQDATGQIRSVSQELRLVGESDHFNWSIGGYFADDRASETDIGYDDENGTIRRLRFVGAVVAPTIPALGTPRYTTAQIMRSFGNYRVIGQINSNVYAGFANAEYRFSDLLKLSAGGRYTNDRQDFSGCAADYNGGNIAVINTVYPLLTGNFGTFYNLQQNQCQTLTTDLKSFAGLIKKKQSENNFAWNVTATLTPSRTTLFYGTIARGFKAGTFPIFAASVETQFTPVAQEQLTSYEVGSKLTLFDRHVQLNASAFYYDYKNKQIFGRVADLIFGSLSRIRNVPKSRVYGLEGDITWRAVPGLTLNASGAYLNSKVLSDFPDFTELGAPANFKGRPFAYTPKYQGTATATYNAPISDSLSVDASITAIYQSSTQSDFAGLGIYRIDPRTIFNATFGLASSSGWQLTAYGKNIFNKYYWTGLTSSVDTVVRYPGMPAEFGLRAAFKY